MPKIIDHNEKKESILSHVSKLILTGSIETLGIREIAKSAKVSVGAITHYFGSKEDFYDSLVNRAGERTNWHLRMAIQDVRGKQEKLNKLIDYIFQNEDEILIQFLIVLDAARARSPKDRERRSKVHRSEHIYFEVLVKDCGLTSEQARFFVTNIIGMLTRRLWTGRSGSEHSQRDFIFKALGG